MNGPSARPVASLQSSHRTTQKSRAERDVKNWRLLRDTFRSHLQFSDLVEKGSLNQASVKVRSAVQPG
jgi:hypothetical protein